MKEDTTKATSDSISNLPLSTGSIVEGKIVARDRSSVFVDLGSRGTGVIYGREFYQSKEAIENLNIGDAIQAKVIDPENEEGYIELSLQDASREISWQKLAELKDSGEIIKVNITGVNKGGLLTEVQGIPAFLPVSQLSPENYPRVADADKQKILSQLQKFIGKTMEVKILDLLARENKLILSEKAKAEQALKEILKNYKNGDVVDGEITGIADFGVFIKFPSSEKSTGNEQAVEGLIHISELDWQLVEDPSQIVKVGETVKAQIIDINNNQVFLSLKRLKENPWDQIEKNYKKGDVVNGKVISFSPFGAFVQISPQIRGLCHVSEFQSKSEMEESLKIGQDHGFEIVLIEPKEHRMSLKLVK